MKIIKFTLLIVLFCFYASAKAQVAENWKVVFNEQFENNQNKWDLEKTKESNCQIAGGKLIQEYTNSGYAMVNVVEAEFDESERFKISFSIANLNYEVKAGFKSTFPMYGFVWDYADESNYSYIKFQQLYVYNSLVTRYKIGARVAGNDIVYKNWTENSAGSYLKTGGAFNEISIVKSGNSLYFYKGIYNPNYSAYNDMLGSCSAEQWRTRKLGIYVDDGAKVVLDYLTIEQFEFFESNEKSSVQNKTNQTAYSGSGLLISKQGHIVTNYHVIAEADHIEIDVFRAGVKSTLLADVLASDRTNDLAILKIRDETFNTNVLPISIRSTPVLVGEDAFALGFPMVGVLGEEVKVTNGIISSKTGFMNDPTTFQISTPIQPGNSGGPLFDMNGYLIGITSSGVQSAENVGYAIKTSLLVNFLDTQESIPDLPKVNGLSGKGLPQLVESLSPFTVLIRVNDPTVDVELAYNILEGGYSVNHHIELKRNLETNEYETVLDVELVSKLYFSNEMLYFKKGTNPWLANKWTYEGYDQESSFHIFYDNFGQRIAINKESTELYFFSERDGEFFNRVYGYYYLKKDDTIIPK